MAEVQCAKLLRREAAYSIFCSGADSHFGSQPGQFIEMLIIDDEVDINGALLTTSVLFRLLRNP
jgi:hypothetical protein